MRTSFTRALVVFVLLAITNIAHAQLVVQDNFTGTSASNSWTALNGACLTAGNGQGSIPSCEGLAYYKGQTQVGGVSGTLPDPVGQGALRLTNGYTAGGSGFDYGFMQSGGIISNFTFPVNEGLNVTFTAISYRGNWGGPGHDGADGISFFLMDGSYKPYDTGGLGGSLGYSCSNTNDDQTVRPDGTIRGYDGVAGAYLGLGIDEYGNFLNPNDNTDSGSGFQPNRIGLRGAGDVSWAQLSENYPSDYPYWLPPFLQQAAVQHTCATGHIWNYGDGSPVETSTTILDYPYIDHTAKTLPSSEPIATESALVRGQAVPITYKLRITPDGLLSLDYSYNGGVYQPVITDQSITAENGPLPKSFRFGFAGSTGGSTNVHELMCFKAEPNALANGSASLNEKESSEIRTGSQVYFAYYDPNTWAGSLTANNLLFNPSTNTVSIAPLANWDASCVLTGVPAGSTCAATGTGPMAAESPSARSMLTWNGSTGIPFEWNDLTSTEKTALTRGGAKNSDRLEYLRGDRALEMQSNGSGKYRDRTSVLGDIVDSSPRWVGPPSAPYNRAWKDNLYPNTTPPEAGGESYANFAAEYAARTNVVYVGANDGFLHGFRAGAYDSSGNWNPNAENDGEELLAYMPQTVLEEIHSVSDKAIDFSNPQYGHAFYVDGSPGSGDLFYNGSWHTWLVGGLGYGGDGIYALDITNPANFSESNASSIVIGDWTPSSLKCVNDNGCGNDLGQIAGTPEIRRFHNGEWGAVFGNGLNSSNGKAGIYIMLVDPNTGETSFYFLEVPASGKDGINDVTPVDLDGDHIVDYVYAGDSLGNVWRFNLTSSDPSSWHVTGTPVFTTPNGEPITTSVVVASIPSAMGVPRVIVAFGTGRETPFSNTSATQYASGTQALYGVWDWNMSGWNSLGSTQMASLPGPQSVSVADLQSQSVIQSVVAPANGIGNGYRIVSSNPICWEGDQGCAGEGKFGWVLQLPSTGEQVIFNPTLQDGAFVVNTLVPATGTPTNCGTTTPTGWTMALSMQTGGAFNAPIFLTLDHHYVVYNSAAVSGVELNATGTEALVSTSVPSASVPGEAYLVSQTVNGSGAIIGFNVGAAAVGRQITWAELR